MGPAVNSRFLATSCTYHGKPIDQPVAVADGPSSTIYRPTMPDAHDEHDEPFVLNLADHPIVAHPVAP